MKAFNSILQFQEHFNTDEKCREFLEAQRWGETPSCVFCGSVKVTRLKDGKRFQCNEKECRKQFTVTVGTVAENTKIPLTKWFLAMYILSNHSKGISALQLASWINVTPRTAWFLNHRIREMLKEANPEQLKGIVQCDETLIGGSLQNQHASKRKGKKPLDNKSMVFGAVEKGGKVRTKVVPATNVKHIQDAITEFVEQGSIMVTDENKAYKRVSQNYEHHKINHRAKEYVRGWVHTNTIEGFWNLLKKQINGIHHFVSEKHLQRYCNEAEHRYNNRKIAQDERFINAIKGCEVRLKYKELIAK